MKLVNIPFMCKSDRYIHPKLQGCTEFHSQDDPNIPVVTGSAAILFLIAFQIRRDIVIGPVFCQILDLIYLYNVQYAWGSSL